MLVGCSDTGCEITAGSPGTRLRGQLEDPLQLGRIPILASRVGGLSPCGVF